MVRNIMYPPNVKGFKNANKTFVSTFWTSLSELAGMKRIGIGPNYEAFLVFNNTISSVQQSRCLVLAL
jgi:hypothetical protein